MLQVSNLSKTFGDNLIFQRVSFIDALEWLEGFLLRFEGAVILVSHDHTYLDRNVSSVLELDAGTRTSASYPGNYTRYLEAKEHERRKRWAAYKEQQECIARLEGTLAAKKGHARSIEQGTIDFAPRKIAKGIARRAVVQQRRLQRLLDSEERIDRPGRTWQMKLELTDTPPSGRDALHLEDVAMGFDDPELFRDVNLTLRAGERLFFPQALVPLARHRGKSLNGCLVQLQVDRVPFYPFDSR